MTSGRSSVSIPSWITSVAMIAESHLGAIAGRWIELVEDEIGELPREEKPWIRDLAGPDRRLLPGRRPRTGRPLRLVAALTDGPDAHRAAFEANRSLWEVWTRIHAAGEFYDLEAFKAGGVRIRPYEIEMIGDVSGHSLLHLQCHFGIDTLSWARLGARVTGADISPSAIELARSLAVELGFPEARFVESNLYDLPSALEGEFDVVYTSRGVLGWLPDIRAWAEVVAHFVAPGGTSSSPRRIRS